jgi:hypothetical protein
VGNRISATATKHAVLTALLVDGRQPVKLVVDPERLGDDHGFPQSVLDDYDGGVPLDLDPEWPLALDLDSDPQAFFVDLAFRGNVCRCRVPWFAIRLVAVGLGGIEWRHESPVEEAPEPKKPARGHLRLVD